MTGNNILYDHIASGLSELDLQIVKSVPEGGNWTNIPESVPSQRIAQIREMAAERGGVVRTTYYGRLKRTKPSYTISTYFNRPGNGCNIHYEQDRTLSIREAARLQSFPDHVRFFGPQGAKRKQIGNAVPPLLGRAIGSILPSGSKIADTFCGAGGLTLGLEMAGHVVTAAMDNDKHAAISYKASHPNAEFVLGDAHSSSVIDHFVDIARGVDVVVGGPPCQGWSYAGWHNRSDKRNDLVWRFLDIVSAIGPRHFVMENVQGLQWMAKGAALNSVLAAADAIGYDVRWFTLNAADFGVPQKRNRVFLLGSKRGDAELLEKPHPIFTSKLPSDLLEYVTVEDAIGDLPRLEPGQGVEEALWMGVGSSPYAKWSSCLVSFEEMVQEYRAAQKMGA
ncbi:DNA (cytosine-5-)-methyltransferase [Agrobacterium deltaense]|uniref:DNA cytosine methyltransferase n=1 Tax=Agrobacterium deltaense TaxID=1183412 RepID=UPI003D952B99